MASGSSRNYHQHQDYIARIRHNNALPVSPLPPKLLDIPNTGLASGQYTAPSFATRLLREQPLTIDADEFGGMDFNLIGFPGAFEGDSRYLKFQDWEVQHDPKDTALLRPLNTLGKASSTTASGVHFLRQKTDAFVSSTNIFRKQPRPDPYAAARPKPKPQSDAEREDPKNILRMIIKGFNMANPQDAYKGPDTPDQIRGADISREERDAWELPRHPQRPELTVLDSYPILPDLQALPDVGGYMMIKYQQNPGESRDRYDPRLDVAILRVRPVPSDVKARFDAALALWEADPTASPRPPQVDDFELFLPEAEDSVRGIKRKFTVTDPQNDDELLYDKKTDAGEPCFKFKKQRRYETVHTNVSPNQNPFEQNVAIALHDPETFAGFVPGAKTRLQKAAYFYPIIQRTVIRAYRPKTINQMMANPSMSAYTADEEDEGKADVLNVTVVPEEELQEDFYDGAEAQRQRLDHRMVVEGV